MVISYNHLYISRGYSAGLQTTPNEAMQSGGMCMGLPIHDCTCTRILEPLLRRPMPSCQSGIPVNHIIPSAW